MDILVCRRPTGGDEQAGYDLENIPPRAFTLPVLFCLGARNAFVNKGMRLGQVTKVAAQLLHSHVFNLGGKAATLHLN